MNKVKLSEVAHALGCECAYEADITEFVTDSRKACAGTVFTAIVGENADGNDYAASALKNGAEAVVVSRLADGVDPSRAFLVEDTKRAYIRIGGMIRDKFDIPFVGVTGSVGKTTTKEFVHAVLSAKYNAHKNEANHNNEIGVPNTLFDLRDDHEAAVIEMAMVNLGEIHDLAVAVKPCTGIITWVGTSHLENLKTRENILKAKLEIRDGMKDGSALLVCGDNDLLSTVSDDRLRIVFYGIDNPANSIKAENIAEKDGKTSFDIVCPQGRFTTSIPTLGRHNVLDALGAFGVGCELGVSPADAAKALSGYVVSGMRQNFVKHGDVTVVEDCYNCAPDSLKAATETLSTYPAQGRRILVVSDMLELGNDTAQLHAGCGKFVAEKGIDMLLAFGAISENTVRGAKEAGMKDAVHFESKQALACAIKEIIGKGDVLWFKASRGQRLEEVIESVFGREETK